MANRMDPEQRHQLRMVSDLVGHPGWPYLMAAWAQLREEKILARMKKARTEMPWRFDQGRLEGFDEAIALPEFLVRQLDDASEELTAAEQAAEVIKNLHGGPK